MPELSKQLRRAAEASTAAKNHLAKSDAGAFGGFLSSFVKPSFDDTLNQQCWFLTHAGELTTSAADAVDHSNDYYQRTDQATAKGFDDKLPATAGEKAPDQVGAHGRYGDPSDPHGRLVEPKDYSGELSWSISLQSDIGNIVSIVRQVAIWVFGEDPFELIVGRLLVGDWNEVRRIADRFNNAAWASKDIGGNMAVATTDGEQDWQGNAAGMAFNYVNTLEKCYDAAFDQNEYLFGKFKDYAEGCFSLFDGLASMVSGWINNRLLPCLASLGIAAATEEVPVLDIFTDAWAAWTLYKCVETAQEIYDTANKIIDMTKVLAGAISMTTGSFHDMTSKAQQLPEAGCPVAV